MFTSFKILSQSLIFQRSITILETYTMTPQIKSSHPKAISFAVDILQLGGVIALPTDTVYGIACCATNLDAINKLYAIKARNENKPVAICIGQESDIEKWAEVKHLPKGLLKSLLPGPVTLVFNCAKKLDRSLNNNGKIGIRVPNYDLIRHICNALTVPLALTSANLSGDPSSVSVDEFQGLWPTLAGILDGGILGDGDSNRSASTVIDLCEPGYFKITRTGIAYEGTYEILKKFKLKDKNSV